MRAPDSINPNMEWHEDLPASEPPALSVYPPDDGEDCGPELLGPDGEVIVRRRLHPIGYHEENGRG